MGKRGQAEVGDGARDAVLLTLVDVTDVFLRNEADIKKKIGDDSIGVTIEEFLERFFLRGVTNQLMRHSVFNSLFQQTFSSVLKQLRFGDLFTPPTWARSGSNVTKVYGETPAPGQARPPNLIDKLNRNQKRRQCSTPPGEGASIGRSKSLSPAEPERPRNMKASCYVAKHHFTNI